MIKIAVVDSQLKERWISCSVILSNIKKSYEQTGHDVRSFNIDNFYTHQFYTCFKEVNAIKEWGADTIVYADYQPVPNFFIYNLYHAYKGSKKKPNIIIHLYGDFSIFLPKWFKVEKELKAFNVKFLVASESQYNLVSLLIKNKNLVHYHPFGVDEDIYKFDPKLRREALKEFNIDPNCHNLVYTGRFTLQKNVIPMVNLVKLANNLTKSKFKMYMAGPFDSLGFTYVGKLLEPGEFENMWLKNMQTLKDIEKQQFEYLGTLNSSKLRALYHATDTFLSLSIHNDEDFGMSPCEAFCSGLRGILSKWGGFNSFELSNGSTSMVPTTIDADGPSVNMKKGLQILMDELKKEKLSDEMRSEISKTFLDFFGVKALAKKLNHIIEQPFKKFTGYSNTAKSVSTAFERQPHAPYLEEETTKKYINVSGRMREVTLDKEVKYGKLYQKIYQAYLDR